MNSFAALVTAFALVVSAPPPAPRVAHEADRGPAAARSGGDRNEPEAFRTFRESYRPEVQEQVHIEQHVVIRLAPSPPSMRREMFDAPPNVDGPIRYKEKKFGGCVAIDEIAGIAPSQNRLLLFMRDHRLLSATLERVCDPDAFYLGAYIERNTDGRLCKGRDALRARTGATCQIARFSRLVALKD
jgi:hypothetical protein